MGSVPKSTYTWSDQYIAEPRKVKIITIGAGIAGIAFGYKAKKLQNVDYAIYERGDDVGGTWRVSRYPGVSCDVPAHSYTYSWAGNPDWSKVYVGAKEIWEWYRKLAKEYGLYEKIKFRHEIVALKWDNAASLWEATIKNLSTGTIFVDRAEFILNAAGLFNQGNYPNIPGLRLFKGQLVHTSEWDETLDLYGKTVAVIGSGASGIQVVPTIQPVAKKVISFNRSPNWVAGEFAASVAWDGRSSTYSEEQKERFRNDPDYFTEYRREVEHAMNARFPAFYKYSEAQKLAKAAVTKSMKERLKDDPVLTKALIPDFPMGLRRVTPGAGYLEALIKENVQVVTDSIVEINEKGVVSQGSETEDTSIHEVDVIIAATGYDTSFVPLFSIIGSDGVDLRERWAKKEGPRAYLSIAIPNYPNYFALMGPNTPISNGSVIPTMETKIDYFFELVKKVQSQNLNYFVPTQEATDEWNEHVDLLMEQFTWSAPYSSWYKLNKAADGRVIGPWPGSVPHFLEALEHPRFEDFYWAYKTNNRFQYFGIGKSSRESRSQSLGWYITGPI